MVFCLTAHFILIYLWFVSYVDSAIYGTPLVFYSRSYCSYFRTYGAEHGDSWFYEDIFCHDNNCPGKHSSHRNSSCIIFKAIKSISCLQRRCLCWRYNYFELYNNSQLDRTHKWNEDELLSNSY